MKCQVKIRGKKYQMKCCKYPGFFFGFPFSSCSAEYFVIVKLFLLFLRLHLLTGTNNQEDRTSTYNLFNRFLLSTQIIMWWHVCVLPKDVLIPPPTANPSKRRQNSVLTPIARHHLHMPESELHMWRDHPEQLTWIYSIS